MLLERSALVVRGGGGRCHDCGDGEVKGKDVIDTKWRFE